MMESESVKTRNTEIRELAKTDRLSSGQLAELFDLLPFYVQQILEHDAEDEETTDVSESDVNRLAGKIQVMKEMGATPEETATAVNRSVSYVCYLRKKWLGHYPTIEINLRLPVYKNNHIVSCGIYTVEKRRKNVTLTDAESGRTSTLPARLLTGKWKLVEDESKGE